MSRLMRGDSVEIMANFPDNSIDFILTDPPYLVGFKDRSGRSIAIFIAARRRPRKWPGY